MNSLPPAELCRITVFGPAGRADLAVPISTAVAGLLPVLLKHTSDPNERPVAGADDDQTSWVLQRLGEPAFDPEGTPESLEWLEGETFYVRPASNPLPEVAFDDVADGVATAVGKQHDRWRPEFSRWLFLTLCAGVIVLIAMVVAGAGDTMTTSIVAGLLGVVLCTSSMAAARKLEDRALSVVLGVPGVVFFGLAGVAASGGVLSMFELRAASASLAGLTIAVGAASLLGASMLWARELAIVPFGVLFGAGLAAFLATRAHLDLGLAPEQAAALSATIALAVLLLAPRWVLRLGRLRGPQLPRTSDELTEDVEPLDTEQIIERTEHADRYLSVFTITASLIFMSSYPLLLAASGWAPATLALLIGVSALIRSGGFKSAWQRVSLVAAGGVGVVLLLLAFGPSLTFGLRLTTIGVLLGVLLAFVLAVRRPPNRRLVPIWLQRANWIESIVAFATVPVLLQILGVYAWARGLAG